jgi:hypothetical protein
MKTELSAIILTVRLMCQNMVIPTFHTNNKKEKRMQMYSHKDTEKP